MSDTTLQPGEIVDDKYTIVSQIGAGGIGAVFEARHRRLDRRVAIKILKSSAFNDDPEFRQRFTREARVMSRLEHPNAVTIYDYGDHHGALYIAMGFLVGHPLDDEVGQGRVELHRAIDLAVQMCDVLTVTHEMNLVHRDIKPENIFITDTDDGPHATLVDFGLAFIATDEDLSRMTQEGLVAGTPLYLSPEQARGQADIGPPSDIYSLGCVLYELLSGSPVVSGDSVMDLLNAHLFVPATGLRVRCPEADIPAALDNFVLSMIAKSAADRPSAFEAATFLRKTLASDAGRGRGRPARLLRPRNQRAVTDASMQAAPNDGGQAVDADQTPRLCIVGDAPDALTVAARAAGWRVQPFGAGHPVDVVVAMGPELVETVHIDAAPTMAVVGSTSISQAVDLLELGVDDLLVDAQPDEVMRKAQRLYNSRPS